MDSKRASRDETILTSVAESIGATLGTLAAKAGAVQKELKQKVTGAKPSVRRAVSRTKKRTKASHRPKRKASPAVARRAKRKR